MKTLFKRTVITSILLLTLYTKQTDGTRYLSKQCDGYYTDGSLDRPCGMCRICRRVRMKDDTIDSVCESIRYLWTNETQFPFIPVSVESGTYCTTRDFCGSKFKCAKGRRDEQNKTVYIKMFGTCKCGCDQTRYGQACEYQIPIGLTIRSFADVQNILYTAFVYSSEFVNTVIYLYTTGLKMNLEIQTSRELLIYDVERCKTKKIGVTELCKNMFEPTGVGKYSGECEGASTYQTHAPDEICTIKINFAFPRIRAHLWNEKEFVRDYHKNPEIRNKPIVAKVEKMQLSIYNKIPELGRNNTVFTIELGFVVFYVGKNKFERCPPNLTIHKYGKNMFIVSIFPRMKELTVSCAIVLNDSPDCKDNDDVSVVTNWYMWMIGRNHDEKSDLPLEQRLQTTSLVLPPYSLDFGLYKVKAEVKVISKQLNYETTYCYFKIIPLPFQPIIVGGSVRYVYCKDHLELITQEIFDYDYPLNQQPVMKYVWMCNDTDSVCSERNTTDLSLTVNGPFTAGKVYNFTMKINSNSKIYAEFTNQIVVMYQDPIPSLLIVCLKNCGGKDLMTDTHEVLHFKVIHSKYSSAFQENNTYKWACTKDDNSVVDLQTIQQEEETPSWVLIIDENKLENNTLYIFKVVGPNDKQGQAKIAIKTFKGLDAFRCDINPKQGIAGETKFYLECLVTNHEAGFYSYTFTIYDMSSETELLGRLVGSSYVQSIGDIVLTRGTVAIYATNTFGQFHKTFVSVKLQPPKITSDFIHENIEALGILSKGEGYEQKISFISAMCDILNDSPSIKASGIERLLEIISKEKANDISQIELLLSVTQSVICVENNCEMMNMTRQSLKYLSQIFIGVADKLTRELIRTYQLTTELTSYKVDIYYTQLLKCAGILLTVHDDKLLNKSYENIDYDVYELFKYSNLNIMRSLQQLQFGLGLRTLPFVKHHAIKTEYVKTWMKEDNPEYFTKGTKSNYEGSYVRVTPDLARYFLRKTNYIVVNTMEFNKDPYWWSRNSDLMTNVISVNIGYKKHQKYHPIKIFPQPIDVFLKKTAVNTTKVSGQVLKTERNNNSYENDMSITIHKVFANKGSTLILKFLNIVSNYSLKVRVMVNRRPDYHDVITGTKITEELPWYYCDCVIKEEDDVAYIGILPGEETALREWLNYTFELQSPRCQVWRNLMWETTGCSLGLESTEELLHCQCLHLSSVAGFLGVPVNTVDPFTDYKLFLTLSENPYVFALVLIIILLYLLLLVWSYKSDKRNHSMLGVIILEDNISSDPYGYLITVFTGSRLFAGTTSKIGIILHGADYSCPPHILKCSKRSTLTRGSDNWFILFAPKYLGAISGIQVWTDYSGQKPNWHCERIHVYDLTSGKEHIFILATWFGIHQYGVCLEKFGKPEDLHQIDFFLINATFGFKENHLWISMLAHHPRSPQMRTHRVSLVVVALIIVLLTNIMFYDAAFPEDVDLPEYELNRRELIISVISIAIAAGAAFLVYLGFFISYSIKDQEDIFRERQSTQTIRGGTKEQADSIRSCVHKRDLKYCFKKMTLCLKNDSFLPILAKENSNIIIIHKCRVIFAWVLCFTVILSASFFIVLCGLKFGKVKSLLWLTSLGLSLGGDIFVVDPIKILLVSFLFGLVHIQMYNVFACDSAIYQLRKETALNKNSIEDEFVLINRLKPFYKPLPDVKVETILSQQVIVKRWWQFIDIVDICFSVALPFLLIRFTLIGEYQIGGVFENTMFRNVGVGKYHMTTPTNISSYYNFIERSVLPALHSTQWYNSQPIHDSQELFPETGWTIDGTHRMIGIPRLRQIRTQQKKCQVPSLLSELSFYCNVLYSPSTEETDDFGTHWLGFTRDDIMFNKSIWNYVDPEDSSSTSVYVDSGQEFHGGGYIVDLARSRRESSNKVWNLDNAGWLDIRSRVVFFEVSTYNVNKNVFTVINVIAEHLETGSALTAKRIWTVYIRNYNYIFNIAYSVYIVLALIKLMMIMNTIGVRVFIRTFWAVYDLILVVIVCLYIVIYVMFSEAISTYIEEFQQSEIDTFFHIQKLIFRLRIRRYLLGLVLCMAIGRLLRLIRYGVRIISDKQKYTLYFSWPQIVWLTIVFITFSHILQRPIAYLMNSFYQFGDSHVLLYWMDYRNLVGGLNHPIKQHIIFISCYLACITRFFYNMILIKNYQYVLTFLGEEKLPMSYKKFKLC